MPPWLDMHITLAYVSTDMSSEKTAKLYAAIRKQFYSRFRAVNGSPLEFSLNVYATEHQNLWKFSTHSRTMSLIDLQALINVVNSFDKKARNSTTMNYQGQRTLHLSIYPRPPAPAWIA